MSFEQRLLTGTSFTNPNTNWPNTTPAYSPVPDGTIWLPTAAGLQVNARDLVALSETNTVSAIDTDWGLTLSNNNTAGASVLQSATLFSPSTNYNTGNQPAVPTMCALAGNLFARVFSGDGTTLTTRVTIEIVNALGGIVVPPVTVSSDTTVWGLQCKTLTNGKILVAWTISTGASLKYAIYNTDLSVSTAVTTVASGTLNSYYFAMTQLVGGSLAFAYQKTVSSGTMAFSIFTQAGVIVGSEVTVETSSSPVTISLLACANGDLVISYYKSVATNAHKIARYSSTGSVVVALAIVYTGTTYLNSWSNGSTGAQMLELANGNIVLIAGRTADNSTTIYFYNSSLVFQRLYTWTNALSIQGFAAAIAITPSGGVIAFSHGSGLGAYFTTFDNTGVLIQPPTNDGTFVSSFAGGENLVILPLGTTGYVCAQAGYDGSTNGAMTVFTVGSTGTKKGSLSVTTTAGGSTYMMSTFILNSSGSALYSQYPVPSGNGVSGIAYKLLLSSIIGVAQTAGSQYAAAQISTKGSFQINQNIPGGVFDCRANSVPGTRGIVAANSCYLAGVI